MYLRSTLSFHTPVVPEAVHLLTLLLLRLALSLHCPSFLPFRLRSLLFPTLPFVLFADLELPTTSLLNPSNLESTSTCHRYEKVKTMIHVSEGTQLFPLYQPTTLRWRLVISHTKSFKCVRQKRPNFEPIARTDAHVTRMVRRSDLRS